MNLIMMAGMLLALYGIMAFIQCLTRLGGAKCLALAVMTVIGVQALGGFLGRSVSYGMSYTAVFLLFLGLVGHLLTGFEIFTRDGRRLRLAPAAKQTLSALYPPAVIGAGMIFLLILFLMRGLLIFRYDDLKQWGAAAKFMTENQWLPREDEFFGSHNHYLTPTFFTSFFGIGGKWVTGKVVEHNFYAANLLFAAAGLILPLGDIDWKHCGKAFGILALDLLGMTALYYHSIANLYVDIILAAWVGGMAILAIKHRLNGRYDGKFFGYYALLLTFTVFIKWGYGILGVCVVLFLMLMTEGYYNPSFGKRCRRLFQNRKLVLIWILVIAILIVAISGAAVLFGEQMNKILPGINGIFTAILDVLFARTDKAVLTTKACLTGLFDQPVTRGSFGYGALVGLLLIVGLGAWNAANSKQHRGLLWRLNFCYLCGSILWFLLILFVYVSNFAYAEATIALSFNRYMGIYLMIGFFVQAVILMEFGECDRLGKALVTLVLLLNINTDLVIESTALDPLQIVGYENVAAVKAQSEQVKELTLETDDILYIGQYGAERGLHRARVDVGMNISAHKPNTYKFADEDVAGYDLSVTRAPSELPQLLIDGGYEYVWVYKSNKELNDFTEAYFGFRFNHATLYRVEIDGDTVRLVDGISLE